MILAKAVQLEKGPVNRICKKKMNVLITIVNFVRCEKSYKAHWLLKARCM